MGIALYRKYRPKTLDEVVGEPQVTETLKKALVDKKISHAYLFIGPRGCGKTSVARIFAHAINDFPYELEDNYVDIVEIDAASNTGVDNIRELREKAAIAPTKGEYKIYIIDEVHMLSKSAFNALLKTLEEPPKHVIFIMATTDAYKVPVTITSRSQIYTFKLADEEVITDHIKNICKKEGIAIDDEAAKTIAKRGGGSFRDTLSLLEQFSVLCSGQTITKDTIIEAMGLPTDEIIDKIITNYSACCFSEISGSLKALFDANTNAEIIAEEIINRIIKNPEPRLIPLLSKLAEVKPPFAEAKLLTALLLQSATSENIIYQPQPAKAAPVISKTPVTPKPAPIAEAKPTPQPVSEPASEPTLIKPAPENSITVPTPQSVEEFKNNLKTINSALAAQMQKTDIIVSENILHIYPKNKYIKALITRDNHKAIIIEAANGLKVEVHDLNDNPQKAANDKNLSAISAIMGEVKEVENNGGDVPF